MYIHLEQDTVTDPRILRTRELLINGFAKLLIERKSIRSVSVQSIAKQAGVNRVTFYAHFRDKYDLLDVWARLLFRQSVVEKLPDDAQPNRESLTLLITATLDFFILRGGYRRRINDQFEPMFETAIQQELQAILASMLGHTHPVKHSVTRETAATFLSWAIFGSLLDWSRTQKNRSKEVVVLETVLLCEALLADQK
jgi:AcrR family transcriptional regulator